jgi:outer membrane protein TolC
MRSTSRLLAALVFVTPLAAQTRPTEFAADRPPPPTAPVRAASLLLPIPNPTLPPPAEEPPKASKTAEPLPANTLPIDLPTALRLANAGSPTIAVARVRVREALARVDQADALRLPTLSAGGIYTRHDGLTQRQDGTLLTVSRQSFFAGGGAALRVDLGEAFYQPLVARRLAAAEAASAQATTNSALFDVASAYFDLVSAHAQLRVNEYILGLATQILQAARSGEKRGLLRAAADVNRAETEVSLRKLERIDLEARAAVASARLVRLLVLDPAVTLVPADPVVVPIDLFPPDTPVPQLIELAIRARPELAAAAATVEAADVRARQARYAPLIPRIQTNYLGGGFSGGVNGAHPNMAGRSDLDAQLFWELRGLGFGNLADTRLYEAQRDRAALTAVAARAQVADEVVEAAKVAAARRSSLPESLRATEEAQEMYRKLSATSFGMIGPRREFDALEPLLAVQALNQSRLSYLGSVIEYNRSQFRLLTAVGQPPDAVTGGGAAGAGCLPGTPVGVPGKP